MQIIRLVVNCRTCRKIFTMPAAFGRVNAGRPVYCPWCSRVPAILEIQERENDWGENAQASEDDA